MAAAKIDNNGVIAWQQQLAKAMKIIGESKRERRSERVVVNDVGGGNRLSW